MTINISIKTAEISDAIEALKLSASVMPPGTKCSVKFVLPKAGGASERDPSKASYRCSECEYTLSTTVAHAPAAFARHVNAKHGRSASHVEMVPIDEAAA